MASSEAVTLCRCYDSHRNVHRDCQINGSGRIQRLKPKKDGLKEYEKLDNLMVLLRNKEHFKILPVK
ncbi:hypothetical protein Ocin01_13558, partial [Orchesella cincta]